MQEAAARYQKINPNVEFDIVSMAKADVEQKLNTILASGVKTALPEIVLIEDYNAQKYLQSYPGSFADLTKQFNYSEFAPYKVKLMTLNNKVYGVPFDSGVTGWFYRRDYLEQAGFKASDLENITWDRFIEIGKVVKAKTGKYMIAADPYDGGLMRTLLQSAGTWYFDSNGKPYIANNPVLKEAVKLYKEIRDSGIAKEVSGWNEWVGSFNNGDSASVITGVWIVGSIKAEKSQSGKWAVTSVPRMNIKGAVNASNLGGSSWYVLQNSKNKDVAIEYPGKSTNRRNRALRPSDRVVNYKTVALRPYPLPTNREWYSYHESKELLPTNKEHRQDERIQFYPIWGRVVPRDLIYRVLSLQL